MMSPTVVIGNTGRSLRDFADSKGAIVLEEEERQIVHHVIYEELCLGRAEPASRQKYIRIMEGLVSRGVQAIILGCTEIGLLIGSHDCRIPIFDTTRVHAEAAVALALENIK